MKKRIRKPEYYVWCQMLARCRNPNNLSYKYYGGRGIRVCERWLRFSTFLLDMGQRPSPDLTLDRIDNDGDYEPSNCRWATRAVQTDNRYKPSRYDNTRARQQSVVPRHGTTPDGGDSPIT